MKKAKIAIAAILFLVSFCWSIAAPAQVDERPLSAAASTYWSMLKARQFDKLDQIADDARKSNKTISDGQPLLGALYDGVAGCVCRSNLTAADWNQRRELLQAWRLKSPKSTTAEVALGTFHLTFAWAARGNGYASTVEAERWDQFRAGVNKAYETLQQASPAARQDPGWYYAMLHIGLAQHWEQARFETIYREGTGKYPLYLPLHFAAANYYSPQWYGSVEQMQAYIRQAVEATRPLLGDTLYARINWSSQNSDMFNSGGVDWKQMKAGFERLVADYPDEWNLNNYGHLACQARDADTVVAVAARIKQPIARVWREAPDYYEWCVNGAKDSIAARKAAK